MMADRSRPQETKQPTCEGWWARHKDGRVTLYYVYKLDGGGLCVWLDDAEDFLAIELLCRPRSRWAGPLPLPWGSPEDPPAHGLRVAGSE